MCFLDSEITSEISSLGLGERTGHQISLSSSVSETNPVTVFSIIPLDCEGLVPVAEIPIFEENTSLQAKKSRMVLNENIDVKNAANCAVDLKLKSELEQFDLPFPQYENKQKKRAQIWPQVLAAISVSFGNMIIGLVSAYSSPALASMSKPNSTISIAIDGQEASWMSSLMPLAALVGGILGGPMIEWIGRKGTSLLTAFPAISAWLLIALAPNMTVVYVGRIIAGVCVGISSLSLPVYLAEVVQAEVRGMLGLLPTTIGNAGILVCYVAGMFLDWQELAWLCAALSLPFLVCIAFMPESPRWLIVKGKTSDAEESLQWLRGRDADISAEMEEIQVTYRASLKVEVGGGDRLTWKVLTRRAYVKPLYVALGLMALQQLCGINPVIFYTVYIFKTAGTTLDSHLCAIIVGVANFASTFAANLVIDKVGRKVLLIVSDALMAVSLIVLATFFYLKQYYPDSVFLSEGFAWIPLASFIVFVVAFSLGLGPVPWIMTAEIFPMRIRAGAVGITTAFHWILTFGIVKVFPDFVVHFGSHTAFYLCAGVCVLGMYFIIRKVPETRGRTLEQIERKLLRSKPKTKRSKSFGPNGLLF